MHFIERLLPSFSRKITWRKMSLCWSFLSLLQNTPANQIVVENNLLSLAAVREVSFHGGRASLSWSWGEAERDGSRSMWWKRRLLLQQPGTGSSRIDMPLCPDPLPESPFSCEFISRLIHWWGQCPHEPKTSQACHKLRSKQTFSAVTLGHFLCKPWQFPYRDMHSMTVSHSAVCHSQTQNVKRRKRRNKEAWASQIYSKQIFGAGDCEVRPSRLCLWDAVCVCVWHVCVSMCVCVFV